MCLETENKGDLASAGSESKWRICLCVVFFHLSLDVTMWVQHMIYPSMQEGRKQRETGRGAQAKGGRGQVFQEHRRRVWTEKPLSFPGHGSAEERAAAGHGAASLCLFLTFL